MTLNLLFFTITINKVKETKQAFIEAKRVEEIMEENAAKHYYMNRF